MKRNIFTLLFVLLIAAVAYPQNYIGMSKALAVSQLQSSFDYGKIEFDQLEELTLLKYCNNDQNIRKVLFFDENGICVKFFVIHNDYDQLHYVIKNLNKSYDRENKRTWIERGIIDFQWQLDKKQQFFALIVTKSNEQSTASSTSLK